MEQRWLVLRSIRMVEHPFIPSVQISITHFAKRRPFLVKSVLSAGFVKAKFMESVS